MGWMLTMTHKKERISGGRRLEKRGDSKSHGRVISRCIS